jgi:hypothetical protein
MVHSGLIVLPGLEPGIHGNRQGVCRDSWMAGSSPAKTIEANLPFATKIYGFASNDSATVLAMSRNWRRIFGSGIA